LTPGQPAFARIDGELVSLPEAGLFTLAHIREALSSIAPRGAARDAVQKEPHFKFTNIGPEAIFHVRANEDRAGLSVVIHQVAREVPTPGSLGVPAELMDGLQGDGLWVLSGGAGQGTSTTAAAVAQALLNTRAAVVCTVETPIEYVLSPGRGVIHQLEVGTHVASYAEAMARARSAEADLTVVMELDDLEALAQALALADRGRLVVGALHARTSVDATRKLVSMLASRRELQLQLANVLRGIYAQRLVPDLSGGRTLAWELLPGNPTVQDLVREGTLAELAPLRTHPLEANLVELAARGEVDAEVAANHAPDRAWFVEHLAQEAKAA
jgi:twitching motility protein PilT